MDINYFGEFNSPEQDELFREEAKIPTEQNPFCNDTEISSYNEKYSHIIPGFFFRNSKCSIRPLKYEKSRLRYFYNLVGVILISKTFLSAAIFIILSLFALFCLYADTTSSHSFHYLLMNKSVKYSIAVISSLISTATVCVAGCRFSEFSFSDLFRNNRNSRTKEIVCFFMTGLFIASLYNAISSAFYEFSGVDLSNAIKYTSDIKQILIIFLYTCIIVPVSDGLIFRGIALKNLSRASQRFGIYISSFLCALACGNILYFIPCLLLSVLFSKMTIKYNTVLPSIIIHIVINTCNTIINIYKDLFCNSDVFISRTWTIVTMASGALFTAYYLIKEPSPKNTAEQKKRTLTVFLGAPSYIILTAMYAAAISANVIFAFFG